jgi:hypothetical protein
MAHAGSNRGGSQAGTDRPRPRRERRLGAARSSSAKAKARSSSSGSSSCRSAQQLRARPTSQPLPLAAAGPAQCATQLMQAAAQLRISELGAPRVLEQHHVAMARARGPTRKSPLTLALVAVAASQWAGGGVRAGEDSARGIDRDDVRSIVNSPLNSPLNSHLVKWYVYRNIFVQCPNLVNSRPQVGLQMCKDMCVAIPHCTVFNYDYGGRGCILRSCAWGAAASDTQYSFPFVGFAMYNATDGIRDLSGEKGHLACLKAHHNSQWTTDQPGSDSWTYVDMVGHACDDGDASTVNDRCVASALLGNNKHVLPSGAICVGEPKAASGPSGDHGRTASSVRVTQLRLGLLLLGVACVAALWAAWHGCCKRRSRQNVEFTTSFTGRLG